MDAGAIQTEVESIGSQLRLTWRQRAMYLEMKMLEAQIAGGMTSYSINGRTVTKDLRWLTEAHAYALQMANVDESGGVDVQPIRFGKRV